MLFSICLVLFIALMINDCKYVVTDRGAEEIVGTLLCIGMLISVLRFAWINML